MQVLFNYSSQIKPNWLKDEMVELETLPRRKEYIIVNGYIGQVTHVTHVIENPAPNETIQRYIVEIDLQTPYGGAQLFPVD